MSIGFLRPISKCCSRASVNEDVLRCVGSTLPKKTRSFQAELAGWANLQDEYRRVYNPRIRYARAPGDRLTIRLVSFQEDERHEHLWALWRLRHPTCILPWSLQDGPPFIKIICSWLELLIRCTAWDSALSGQADPVFLGPQHSSSGLLPYSHRL